MSLNPDINMYSINDLKDAWTSYDPNPETEEILLYFLSELTGMSVDALSEIFA